MQTHNSNTFFRQAILVALTELREQEPDKFIELFNSIPESLIIKKIGWLKGETTLNAFYNSLIKHKFISCNFELFRIHFEGTEQPKAKTIWQANLNELAFLFSRLREEGIIPLCKNPHLLLQEIFLDKYGKPIKAGSLRTLLEKGISNGKRKEVIDKIIDVVLAYKNK